MCACNKIGCRSSSTKKAGFVCVSEKPEEAKRGEENIKSHSQGINAICKKMQFFPSTFYVETAMQKWAFMLSGYMECRSSRWGFFCNLLSFSFKASVYKCTQYTLQKLLISHSQIKKCPISGVPEAWMRKRIMKKKTFLAKHNLYSCVGPSLTTKQWPKC